MRGTLPVQDVAASLGVTLDRTPSYAEVNDSVLIGLARADAEYMLSTQDCDAPPSQGLAFDATPAYPQLPVPSCDPFIPLPASPTTQRCSHTEVRKLGAFYGVMEAGRSGRGGRHASARLF